MCEGARSEETDFSVSENLKTEHSSDDMKREKFKFYGNVFSVHKSEIERS